jgi:HSP20 family protein
MAGLVPFNRKKSDLMNTDFYDFQNMLDDFFADGWGWPFRRSLAGDTFKIDVQDSGSEYIVEAELPGVRKEEVGVSFDDGRLKIEVRKEENAEDKGKNYIHRERRFSSMARTVSLADAVSEGVTAKMDDGVLAVTVPKRTRSNSSIQIDFQ